jgi:sulfonate transport system ATP-binding protein
VDEAVLLADRIVVLDHGQIAVDVRPHLPEPRSQADPAFQKTRTQLLTALGVTA